MVPRVKRYAKVESQWLDPLLRRPAGALAVHWVFQGMLQMDRSERAFKLLLDVIGTVALSALFRLILPRPLAVGLAALAAHTLNFVFNGQIYGALKHYGGVERTWEAFSTEVDGMKRRIDQEDCITFAAAYGSMARSEWRPTSDLDVRLVRAPGLICGLRANCFALGERSRAFFRRFPLDLLVVDSYGALASMAERDEPVILSANDARLTRSETHGGGSLL